MEYWFQCPWFLAHSGISPLLEQHATIQRHCWSRRSIIVLGIQENSNFKFRSGCSQIYAFGEPCSEEGVIRKHSCTGGLATPVPQCVTDLFNNLIKSGLEAPRCSDVLYSSAKWLCFLMFWWYWLNLLVSSKSGRYLKIVVKRPQQGKEAIVDADMYYEYQ